MKRCHFTLFWAAPSVTRGRLLRYAFVCLLGVLLSACENAPSAVAPRGPAAARIAEIWWFLLIVGGAVYVAVIAFLLVALFRRRRRAHRAAGLSGEDVRDEHEDMDVLARGSRIVLYAGIVAPAIILLVVFGYTVFTLNALAMPDTLQGYTVHIVGRQWWWEVRYPEQEVVTANEIHIPAGQPVRVVLSSEDVIHSFWVPELQGKLDLVPGQTNEFWIEADEPGVYAGLCAEFCGVQHAKMGFLVIAQPQAEFDAWIAAQKQPAREPTDALALRGQDVFLNSTCINCHAVAGTQATGDLGPDLTHLASRRSLAAATIPNSRGNLAGWIANPQHIKPGALMPPTPITGSDLQALLAYLATLE